MYVNQEDAYAWASNSVATELTENSAAPMFARELNNQKGKERGTGEDVRNRCKRRNNGRGCGLSDRRAGGDDEVRSPLADQSPDAI